MIDHIQLIHDRWLQDNYRTGALGIIIRDYLAEHPTSLTQYEQFIDAWRMPQDAQEVAGTGFSEFIDWHLPSLVESLTDWSYDEEQFFRNMLKSQHARHWISLFPHAFSRMPLFDLAAAFRWEPLAKTWPEETQKMFYAQLDATVSKTFVSIELNRPCLRQMNLLRLSMCLNAEHYSAQDKQQGKPWNAVWTVLQHDDWKHQNDLHFKDLCEKWIRYAPVHDLVGYMAQANALLRNPIIQWHIPFLDNFVCRVRNNDESGAVLLQAWAMMRAQQSQKEKKIPWDYVLNKWTDWEPAPLLQLILDQTTWQQELQELVLAHSDYPDHIKREVLLYRCENDLIGPRDIEICKSLSPNLQHILMFWLVYPPRALKKETVKIFQSLFKWHPLYEQDALMNQYLPGFAGIRTAINAMNVPWRQALAYAEEAMRCKADVHASVRKEFELVVTNDIFESHV